MVDARGVEDFVNGCSWVEVEVLHGVRDEVLHNFAEGCVVRFNLLEFVHGVDEDE